MIKDMELSQIIETLLFLGGIIAVWVKVQTKLKELEMRMQALESQLSHVEQQDNRIMSKLDDISDQITELKIKLNDKQDRKTVN